MEISLELPKPISDEDWINLVDLAVHNQWAERTIEKPFAVFQQLAMVANDPDLKKRLITDATLAVHTEADSGGDSHEIQAKLQGLATLEDVLFNTRYGERGVRQITPDRPNHSPRLRFTDETGVEWYARPVQLPDQKTGYLLFHGNGFSTDHIVDIDGKNPSHIVSDKGPVILSLSNDWKNALADDISVRGAESLLTLTGACEWAGFKDGRLPIVMLLKDVVLDEKVVADLATETLLKDRIVLYIAGYNFIPDPKSPKSIIPNWLKAFKMESGDCLAALPFPDEVLAKIDTGKAKISSIICPTLRLDSTRFSDASDGVYASMTVIFDDETCCRWITNGKGVVYVFPHKSENISDGSRQGIYESARYPQYQDAVGPGYTFIAIPGKDSNAKYRTVLILDEHDVVVGHADSIDIQEWDEEQQNPMYLAGLLTHVTKK